MCGAMEMDTILETLYKSKELYSSLFYPVCVKYKLTLAELLVLLLLADHRECDTARDIVDRLKLAKSHVSVSVRNLEKRGYLKSGYEEHDRRRIHLQLCDAAADAVAAAQETRQCFLAIVGQGFSEEELENLADYLRRVTDNMSAYLRNTVPARAKREHSREVIAWQTERTPPN